MRFKNSKKRCNLVVKNIPQEMTKPELDAIFSQYGVVQSSKLEPSKNENSTQFAFVCFQAPDQAAAAKATLQNAPIGGKNIHIDNYELPHIRR
jgi:RNA recognition motif-containing protein